MSRFRRRVKSESGFSLTEVLIAIVILAIAGATILNSMNTDTKVRGKTNQKTNLSLKLDGAADVLLSRSVDLVTNCGSNAAATYENALPSDSGVKVKVTKVEALTRDKNPIWQDCASGSSVIDSAAQKITLCIVDPTTKGVCRKDTDPDYNFENNEKRLIQKVIVKTSLQVSTNAATTFNINASSTSVKVAAQDSSIASSCGSSTTLTLTNSISSSSVTYSAIPEDTNKVSVSSSGSSLTINGLAESNSTKITIIGFNTATLVTSSPIQIDVTILSPIGFNSPVERNGGVEGYPISINQGLVSLVSGGSTSTKQISLSNSSEYFTTGTNSTLNWKNSSITAPAGLYQNYVSITDPGLPNAENCTNSAWKVPVRVKSKLKFALNLTNENPCIVGTLTSCSIPLNFSSRGSGTGFEGTLPTIYNNSNESISWSATACTASYTGGGGQDNIRNLSSNSIIELKMTKFGGGSGNSDLSAWNGIKSVNLTVNGQPLYNWNFTMGTPVLKANGSIDYVIFTVNGSAIESNNGSISSSSFQITNSSWSFIIKPARLGKVTPVIRDLNVGSTAYSVSSDNELPIYCNRPS